MLTERGERAVSRERFGRDFKLYFGGQLISQLGSAFTMFALPLLVYKTTGSATGLAITTVANFTPYLLFGLVLGAIVDRVDRRRLMRLTDWTRAGVIAVLPILALLGTLHPWQIYIVAFVQSTLGILFDCGEFAAIPSLVSRDSLVVANGRIQATNYAGRTLGPALAGVMVLIMSPADLLFVDAASFAVSALTLSIIRTSFNTEPRSKPPKKLREDVMVGLRYVWNNPLLRTISAMMALINFVAITESTQLVLFGHRVLHASNAEIAWLYAAGACGVVLVSGTAGTIRRHITFAPCVLGGLMISGLTAAAMAAIGSYPAALILWAASSGFGLLLNINTTALRQAIVPSELYGRVVSIAGVLAWSGIPLGALAGSAAISLTGSVATVYIAVGAICVAIACGFAFSPIRHGEQYLTNIAETAD